MVGIPIGITSSAVGLKTFAITAGIKKYKSIIKKTKKELDKIELLTKSKSNSIKVLKASVDSNISHDKFLLVNNALIEYDNLKGEIKNVKT